MLAAAAYLHHVLRVPAILAAILVVPFYGTTATRMRALVLFSLVCHLRNPSFLLKESPGDDRSCQNFSGDSLWLYARPQCANGQGDRRRLRISDCGMRIGKERRQTAGAGGRTNDDGFSVLPPAPASCFLLFFIPQSSEAHCAARTVILTRFFLTGTSSVLPSGAL